MKNRQNGLSTPVILIALSVLLLASVTGWYIWSRQSSQPDDGVKTETARTDPTSADKAPAKDNGSLTIKEWGVVLTSPAIPADATYRIITNNTLLKPNAFLSTQEADSNKKCQDYYTPELPSFQHIERYGPEDRVPVDEGLSQVSIAEAAQKMPDTFKVIDGYGYWFRHGNGMPCRDQDFKMLEAFKEGFSNLSSAK